MYHRRQRTNFTAPGCAVYHRSKSILVVDSFRQSLRFNFLNENTVGHSQKIIVVDVSRGSLEAFSVLCGANSAAYQFIMASCSLTC